MAVGIIVSDRDITILCESLKKGLPQEKIYCYPDFPDPKEIECVIAWKQDENILSTLPQLKWVSSFGAGIDHLLQHIDRGRNLILTRFENKKLSSEMASYVAMAVLNYRYHINALYNAKPSKKWPSKKISQVLPTIGIMGMGNLGKAAAKLLTHMGFPVIGYSQSKKSIKNIPTYRPGEKNLFLSKSQILVCLLPLTEKTKDILDYKLFSQLPTGAYIINVARGAHLVEADLIKVIKEKIISGACLDVYRTEPLPETHPFWEVPEITITPHIASISDQKEVAKHFIENYQRYKSQLPMLSVVDQNKGY